MENVQVDALFDGFSKLNCLVIGDVMVDAYLWGSVNRISPEAPVPIFEVTKRENRLGGAANVALNLKALGANPILCGVIGKDVKGDVFNSLLNQQDLIDDGILEVENRPTISKTRIISGSHHMLRVDEEELGLITKDIEEQFINRVTNILKQQEIQVAIFEDYDKGLLSKGLIQKLITILKDHSVIITVDPKKNNFLNYKEVDLFKPNFKEFKEGSKKEIDKSNFDDIHLNAVSFLKNQRIQNMLITLSEHGVLLSNSKDKIHVKAIRRNISDVSGAGDTVIAVASLALAMGLSMDKIALISNLSGGLVCEEVGVVPVDKNRLIKECKLLFQ